MAPRLWMDPHTVDGGYMSTSAEDREYAMWRSYRSIDIANELGTDLVVLWLAREGTLCAESKSPVWATQNAHRIHQQDAGVRPQNPHLHRAQAQRAHRPEHLRHHGPRDGHFGGHHRPPPGWAATWRAPTPSWPAWDPAPRDRLRHGHGQADDRPPQRPERHPL